MRVQYAKKKGEKALQYETHVQVLLNTFGSDLTVQSEILSVKGCDAQSSGGVKAQCFTKAFDEALDEVSTSYKGKKGIREWCAKPFDPKKIIKGLSPYKFQEDLLAEFGLTEPYNDFARQKDISYEL